MGAGLHHVDAVHQFHPKEGLRAVDDQLVQRDEIGVADVGERTKLALEVIDLARVQPADRFQGDGLIAFEVQAS